MNRLLPLFLAVAFTGLAATAPQPAHAQSQRAYAPERIWELSVPDQRRVIAQEYREQSNGRSIPDDQMRFYLDQIRLSRWTFSRIKQDIASSLRGQGGGIGPGGGGDGTIRCESTDGRQRTCNTPWNRNSILVRQISSTRCIQGQNWNSSPGRVWVSGGCRAEFAAGGIGGGGDWNGEEVKCESTDGRYRTCGTGLYGSISVLRQLSDTRCVLGQNFGLRNGSVWVDRGCRALFRVDRRGGGGGWQGDYSVTCSSQDGRYTTCAWDRSRGVPRLIETLSNSRCQEGYSWGWNRNQGLWVNHGCRARFGVR